MTSTKWGGERVMNLRAKMEATFPRPCARCGKAIQPGMKWHLDHARVPRKILVKIGADIYDPALLQPSHARCNLRAGAKARVSFTRPDMNARSFKGARPESLPPVEFTRSTPIYVEDGDDATKEP